MDRLELFHDTKRESLAQQIREDIETVSPETEFRSNIIDFKDPWDLEEVYSKLLDFAKRFEFDEQTRYLINLTTGTHVAQICWFFARRGAIRPWATDSAFTTGQTLKKLFRPISDSRP